MNQYSKVAVGGTFDQLHRGHKALLNKAFEVGEKVVIGLSTDNFVAHMGKPHKTSSYSDRKKELEAFLAEKGLSERAEIVPLNDSLGLTIKGKGLEALIVSEETAKTAQGVNPIREKAKLPLLDIVTVKMVPAENCSPISTTRIRRGEIDRNGHLLNQASEI
jgi:pantetheine-phosphate adenylyltransferase